MSKGLRLKLNRTVFTFDIRIIKYKSDLQNTCNL